MLLFLASISEAVEFMGGQGLFYTQPSQINQVGQFNLTLYQRLWFGSGNGPSHQLNTTFNANYGLFPKWELGITQILYQDRYVFADDETKGLAPGNTYFHIRYAKFKFHLGQYPIFMGLDLSTCWRTASNQNIYLETIYSGGGIEGAIHFLFSYYTDPEYIEESNALHLNIGYKNLNDAPEIGNNTQELPYSLAFVKVDPKKEFSLEAHGSVFLQRYYDYYTNTSYLYLCPGFKYKFDNGLCLAGGLDVKVFEAKGKESDLPNDLPRYSAWRLNLAVTGLFRCTKYASRQQIDHLEKVKASVLSIEQVLEQKKAERVDWEQKVEQKQLELNDKQAEKEKVKTQIGK
jgi:hypothetical protein